MVQEHFWLHQSAEPHDLFPIGASFVRTALTMLGVPFLGKNSHQQFSFISRLWARMGNRIPVSIIIENNTGIGIGIANRNNMVLSAAINMICMQ
jgi:hypothetical protein